MKMYNGLYFLNHDLLQISKLIISSSKLCKVELLVNYLLLILNSYILKQDQIKLKICLEIIDWFRLIFLNKKSNIFMKKYDDSKNGKIYSMKRAIKFIEGYAAPSN